MTGTKAKTWEKANDACKKENYPGAMLASITTPEENGGSHLIYYLVIPCPIHLKETSSNDKRCTTLMFSISDVMVRDLPENTDHY